MRSLWSRLVCRQLNMLLSSEPIRSMTSKQPILWVYLCSDLFNLINFLTMGHFARNQQKQDFNLTRKLPNMQQKSTMAENNNNQCSQRVDQLAHCPAIDCHTFLQSYHHLIDRIIKYFEGKLSNTLCVTSCNLATV